MINPDEMRAAFDLSLPVVGLAVVLSTVSAVTALLIRIERELSAMSGSTSSSTSRRSLPRMLLFCAAHMASAWLAGTLAFLMSESGAFDVWAGLAFVVVASFSGARFVEAIAARMFPTRTVTRTEERP